MFNRQPSSSEIIRLPYTADEMDRLVNKAMARAEIIDGVEHIDGHPLPPDNDEIWNPQTITMSRTKISGVTWVNGKQQPEYTHEEYEFPSRLTNSFIRSSNLRCIAQGYPPLFITWEQLRVSTEKRETERAQNRSRLAKFILQAKETFNY